MEGLKTELIQEHTKLIKGFKEDCRLRGMTDETIRRYISSVRIFLKFLAGRESSVVDVNLHILRDFLHYLAFERKVKGATLEQYFSALSTFYDYLVFEGIVNSNIILPFRKRYLKRYKSGYDDPQRRVFL